MLKESAQVIETMDMDTKWQKDEIRIKCRDMQIHKLKEQIIFRDELLEEARKMMKSAGVSQDLEDERIIPIADIVYDQQIAIRGGDRNDN